MNGGVVWLDEVLSAIEEYWAPRRVGTVNDYDVKVVKVLGEFVPHAHPDSDEFFLVLDGELLIDLPDGEVRLGPRDIFVVPKGVRHRPRATIETTLLLFEPVTVVNTGDAGGPLTRAAVDI